VLAVLAVASYAALALWLFAVPHDQRAIRADAIVVLSGSSLRLPAAMRLVRGGDAPLLVISRNLRPTALERRACAGRVGVRTICVHASPYSTRGEAQLIARFARKRRWQAVDVVTSQYHVFRARTEIERCYHGRLAMVGAPNPGGLDLVTSLFLEPIKLVYHEVVRAC
jgi:uncharacterized SAM-binding protein YcdF (DUF218 family)